MINNCSHSKSLIFFQAATNGRNFGHFEKIAHKVAKSKYCSNTSTMLTFQWPRGGGGEVDAIPPTGFSNFSREWEELFAT